MTLQNPPGFTVRTEAQQAAFDNGYRLDEHWEGAWGRWRSATAPGAIWIAGAGPYDGPWFLALEHSGAIAECGLAPAAIEGPGAARFMLASRGALGAAVGRVYRLSVSLPTAPLDLFRERLAQMPSATEVEAVVRQRVGQDVFRDTLMHYWEARCPITGIADPALLRASHIVAWAECENDAQRLDVHNGLLLSALWDAAFDRGLVSFADDGAPLYAPRLSEAARRALAHGAAPIRALTPQHRANLARHRRRHGFGD